MLRGMSEIIHKNSDLYVLSRPSPHRLFLLRASPTATTSMLFSFFVDQQPLSPPSVDANHATSVVERSLLRRNRRRSSSLHDEPHAVAVSSSSTSPCERLSSPLVAAP
uniref:Uncharacterized protein n=1 Tax=Cucumis melo TaxID=3656 RepID=A0A9I9EMI9_CUCME